jgi:hypothetical protein
VPQLSPDDLHGAAGGNSEKGAEEAEQLDAHEHADEHRERVQAHGREP